MKGKRSQKEVEELKKEKEKQEIEELDNLRASGYEQNEDTGDDESEDSFIPEQDEQPQDYKTFDSLVKEFKANEGWIHVSLQKDRKPKVKISKYRPAEFDRDEIAKIYGGGLYSYDLRNKYGQRVAVDEQRYAENDIDLQDKNNAMGNGSTGLNQALELVSELTKEISDIKQKIAEGTNNKTQDGIIALITAMNEQNKQQQQQTMQLFTLMFQSMQQAKNIEPQNTVRDTLELIEKAKNLIPQPEKETKPQMTDAVALVQAISDLKETGVEAPKSVADVLKDFLTDGSLFNLVNAFKKKPLIGQAPEEAIEQNQQISQQQTPKQENRQIPQQTELTRLEQAQQAVLNIFKTHEKSLLNLKMDGYLPEDTANTILNLGALAPELKQVFYIAFDKWQEMFDLISKNTSMFANDVDYLKAVCLTIHNTFYEQEIKDQAQS